MLLLGSLLLVAVSIICAEREYFHKSNSTTWDTARGFCKACYKDLTTLTPTNAEVLGLNLTTDYWIGLRQSINGSKFWSRWANGEPVLYQNWYPGHPVLKKKPEPQPTCPTPPIINDTKTDVMQCPAFTKLCACLNSSEDIDSLIMEPTMLFNTTINSTGNGMMWCPALVKLCDCLNSSEDSMPTTVVTTSNLVTSPTPTMLPSTSFPTSTISSELEPEYIEDSCVALLSFGMWQERQCNESLPYICYDEPFFGVVKISNVTKSTGNLSWSEAGKNVSQYKVELNGSHVANVNVTNYPLKNLNPGRLYSVQVIPVKCDRELNAQNISFYTLPEEITNLRTVSVETTKIRLSWNASNGTNVFYVVNSQPGNFTQICLYEDCNITNLQPGQKYTFTVRAVVNVTIFGDPGNAVACTKPSKVNLTSLNNDSTTIYAVWDSPDNNSRQYSYTVILHNIKMEQTWNKFIVLSKLEPGTKYNLSVLAREPNCFEDGEAVSINAFTTPLQVSNLQLNNTYNSIYATWTYTNRSFVRFNVTITNTIDGNSTINSTADVAYNFTFLKSAVKYNVSVITYIVGKDLNPSAPVRKSIYTKPYAPRNASVQILNNTALNVSWEMPINSVKNITYLVTYDSDFWGDTGNLSVFGHTSVIIGELKPGTKYKFDVMVLAGDLKSDPSNTTGVTKPEMRNLTLTMLCSSSTMLYCMDHETTDSVLQQLRIQFKEAFDNNIFWNITVKDKK